MDFYSQLKLTTMKFHLPKLPFERTALEPHISGETIDYHYGKHHQAYINNLNKLIEGTEFENLDLEDIILNADGGIFNNAAQTWNHTFYFGQLSPNPKTAPEGELSVAIDSAFGSLEKFKEDFGKAGATLFGSGWVWLAKNADGNLEIIKTSNAENPMTEGYSPLLVCDVWEHAYYIDYQNKRPDYLSSFWNVFDWSVIENRFNFV